MLSKNMAYIAGAFFIGTATATTIAYILIPKPQPITLTQTTNTPLPTPEVTTHEEFLQSTLATSDSENIVEKIGSLGYCENNFDKLNWGMRYSEVKELFTENTLFDESLVSKTLIAQHPVYYVFHFAELNLAGVTVIFIEDFKEYEDYVLRHNEIHEVIELKHGPPNSKATEWLDETYKGDNDLIPYAIALGHVKLTSRWENPTNSIKITTYADEGNIFTSIYYFSQEYKMHIEHKIQSDLFSNL